MKLQGRSRRAPWIIVGAVTLFIVGLAVAYALKGMLVKSPAPVVQAPATAAKSPSIKQDPTLRFAAMGDMLAHDSIRNGAVTPNGYDFTPYFAHIKPLYATSDVVFCNPETLAAGEAFGISGYPAFNAPTEFARDLSRGAGCNLINLATNHMNDKGQAAIDKTLQVWHDLKPLAVAGANATAADRDLVHYFTKNDITVAFVAMMDFSNIALTNDYGVETYHDTVRATAKLAEARKNADLVVVSAHWGTEDSTVVNEDQKKTAQFFADSGVDVVIGTGPHVLQTVEWVGGASGHRTLVWYSIGNMLSSQLKLDELTGGVASFTVTKKASGISVDMPEFAPTYMSYDWPPADRAAENLATRTNLLLQPLSAADANITKMFNGETVASRRAFVEKTLGTVVEIK